VKCDTLKCVAIMLALANGNFSRKCSSSGPKIENNLPRRASLRHEMSPVLKRTNYREIWACESTFESSVSVSFFSIFRVPSLSVRNNRWLLVAEISPWMAYRVF
jgi:hypothetical protein